MPRRSIISHREETHLRVIAKGLLPWTQTMTRLGSGPERWRETMKTMIIAAAAALSLSMGVAYADSEGGQVANTQFTELPGVVS